MKKPKNSKYWETRHAVPAGKDSVHCVECNWIVSQTAPNCPSCGSKYYFGHHKRRHAREKINDNTLVLTTVALCLIGIVHGIATSSGMISAIFAAAWQGTVGALFGVPVGFAINFMRFFGRRGGLR